jgi:hypothetical protein
MKFSKDFLQDNVGRCVERKIIDHSRWSVTYSEVFEHEGKFYLTSYSVGATESQDESPYQYDGEDIECNEVKKVSKVCNVWETVAD